MIRLKTPKEIDMIRRSGRLAARVLKEAIAFTRPGVTTNQIDELVHRLTLEAGARPSSLGYHGFPKSLCTSINEVVTHGIPSGRTLQAGDIVNLDITCELEGYHGDLSATVILGEAPQRTRELVEVTREALRRAIKEVRPGVPLGEIGEVIHALADEHGMSVVREYCGHGIGRAFHEDPLVLHYRTSKPGPRLAEGMVFTIEPMINLGGPEIVFLPDGWTIETEDGSLSAQFEHTLWVTNTSCEILTAISHDVEA